MKTIRYIALICVLIITVSSCAEERPNAVLHSDPAVQAIAYSNTPCIVDIQSPQGFVYAVQDDCLVFSKGEDKVIYPGSTSKLLTILYARSLLTPERVVTAGDELDFVKKGSSIAYIKKGHQLTVEMLIEGMLLPSGNDAAYVLAAAIGREITSDSATASQALDAFTEGVRDYAKALGLCGTVITVPDGYANGEHYTTTEDMALVAKAAMADPIIAKYAGIFRADVRYASGETNTWVNTNKLLDQDSTYYSPYAIGLKTGSIQGEYSLIFAFRLDDGREYIAGVFGANKKNTRFEDANIIIEYFKHQPKEQ